VSGVTRRGGAHLRLEGRATAALACGVVGLFLFNIVFGPIAIVLGFMAARRYVRGTLGWVAGLIGIALGVADLVVLAVLLAGRIHGGTIGLRLG
jgi:membrane-associated protease RseP (regulator of RpoE activity)